MKGSIKSTASSGDITFIDFDGDLEIEATSGDVELKTGKGTLSVRTSSGEIDGDEITLTGDADFDATSGNIEVDFTNDLSDLSFDLSATSGDLEVGRQEAEKRLKIERGGYTVRGVTSSGDQEYNWSWRKLEEKTKDSDCYPFLFYSIQIDIFVGTLILT